MPERRGPRDHLETTFTHVYVCIHNGIAGFGRFWRLGAKSRAINIDADTAGRGWKGTECLGAEKGAGTRDRL